ncbi:hypothetical protein WN943_025599 [Citrus x changshan-huyou]
MDLFQPAAKRFKLSSPHCCASDNTPNSKPLLQVVSRKLPLSSKSSGKEGSGYVKLEELLAEETWLEVLHGELQKPYAKRLCEFVEKEIKDSGVDIFPPQHLIFNALNTTPFDRVKAVIIGQDPYHGPGQAMGLSFSVPEGVKIPSSLANIFKEIHQDVGCRLPSHGNLEKWAVQNLHNFLLFVCSVRRHQANSHAKKGWEQFTDAVIKAISDKKEGVVFLLWGNSAQEKSRLINVTKHHILKAAHPSGLSANRGFFGCRLVLFHEEYCNCSTIFMHIKIHWHKYANLFNLYMLMLLDSDTMALDNFV